MKTSIYLRILIFGAALFMGNLSFSQVTVTSKYFPVAGKNYIYSTSADSIDFTKTGANYSWDFSDITAVSQDTFKYLSPSAANILYAFAFSGDVALDLKNPGIKGYGFYKT